VPPAAPSALDRLADAANAAAAGDFATVARVCEEVLREAPGHPAALELLARRETEAGRPLAALALSLDAARGLAHHPLPASVAYGVWTALNGAFLDAVAGQDAAGAEARREAYRTWQATRRVGSADVPRDVAVVLVLTPATTPEAARVSLDSLAAQSRRPAEVVVASVGASSAMQMVRARIDLMPFEVRIAREPAATLAAALEAGVAATHAPWIVALEPPHAFAPRHLETLVDGVAGGGAQWGFSDCALEPFGEVPAETMAERVAANDATRTSIARADALGFAFIDQTFAATGAGAVLFGRKLYSVLGGFRPLPGHELWDFCVRAMWVDDPVHVAAKTYRHAVGANEPVLSPAERETAQTAIFRDYYARACREDATPGNPYAPCLARWGVQFVRRMFRVGHVLMVDIDTLDYLRSRIVAIVEAAQPPMLAPGINLIGFAFGEFGLGESLRALARACEAGGIPFVVKDVEQHLATRQADRSVVHHLSEDVRHRLSLMCLNPDMLKPVRALLERTQAAGGRSVGYWYWELETTPRTWEPAFAAVDEIWCATTFVADAIRRATAKAVIKIPPPMEVVLARPHDRAEYGLPQGRLLFLFTFDYNSFVKRKNPEAVIAAFKAAFPRGRGDVGLVVKSVNGTRRPERVAAIMALIGGDPRIVHLDSFLSRDETYGLIDATDVYVSLHRAEGLGLGLAEAMALGKPVIGTGYSGNLEFMNEGNSLLVDYRIVPVAPGEYLVDDERFVWADPDIESAARHMRSLADDAALRIRLAAAGQREIRTRFTRERTASLLRQRLVELGMQDERATERSTTVATLPVDAGAFISYAQNGEDALLARVLRGVERGRYVDIGAHDADMHSVTRAFYERGWSGVNVEPVAEWHALLEKARPRDVNLEVAVAQARGVLTLHEFAGTGLSTLDSETAQRHVRAGRAAITREVPVLPLAEILAAHADGEVHFLKIDVEGAEASVLAGADFRRHRPWIVVVEATAPLTGIPMYAAWEPRLVDADYRFAYDDGLNRYYVSDEHAELAARFADDADAPPVIRAAEALARASDLAPEQRYDPRALAFLDVDAPEPTLASPTSQLCTASQFGEAAYRGWCRAIHEPPALRRKQWEYVWLLQCLAHAGKLQPGRRGLGFGCGREPLAAAMAAQGCEIVATDLDQETAAGHGWIETGQHARQLDDLNERGICPPERFRERVVFRAQDMNAISDDLTDFDFVWSSCSFEHLGSIERGLAFVLRAMRCLKPGGLAVHTTEFNLSSNGPTLETEDLSVYRRQDIERLVRALERAGHRVWPLNLQPGTGPVDRYVDVPPYRPEPHLKLRLSRFVITSIGLAIERAS
jgi:FkbM family methyltransferase